MSLDEVELEQKNATLYSILSLGNMKAIRLVRGMTQQQLALKSDLDRRQISFYETGRKIPRLEAMLKIAEALGIGNMQLKFMDTTGREEVIETICAVEILKTDRTSYIYRKTKEGYLISKRRM